MNETYETTISYVSSSNDILSNSGLYTRPYNKSLITYTVTIKYGSVSKTISIELPVEGFKELDNISATYIGGNSSNYKSLSKNLFEYTDIIICGFAYPGADGTFTESSVNDYNFKYYLPNMSQYVLPKAHEQGTWVLLSICGVDDQYDNALETICSNDDLLNTFVNNIIGLINTYGFDGIDIDWEVPNDGTLFTKLMESLYVAVKANNPNHLVTAAIGGGSWQPPYYDLENSSEYIDYINMMSYNMATESGYHHTALNKSSKYYDIENKVGTTLASCSIEESIAIYNNYGVSNNKIIIGAAFYGILQTRTLTDGVYSSWTKNSNPSYGEIVQEYLNKENYTYYYDSNANAPYLLSDDGLTFISYDDETSIIAKCNYANTNGLAGVFAWNCTLDYNDTLLSTIYNGLK